MCIHYNAAPWYLQTMLQDEEKFSTSRGYFVFVMFTFFVSLIMLNILIAIASSSYETAKSVGPGIFRVSTNPRMYTFPERGLC